MALPRECNKKESLISVANKTKDGIYHLKGFSAKINASELDKHCVMITYYW